jgi:Transposase
MKGNLREPGDPIGSIQRSTMGATCEGRPERGAEPRSGVGPFRSTNEASEGNEGVEGREWPERNQSGEAKVRTPSRVALPLNLWRVYAAARRNKQAQFTALMHHVDVVALERAFRRLKRKASAGVDRETVGTYEQNLAGNLKDLCERVHMFLDEWCRQTMRSRIEPIKKIARSLRQHRELILNYFRAGKLISSGVVEGLNNKAKVTMRKSYGFRTYRVLELALYHSLGKLPKPQSTHDFF